MTIEIKMQCRGECGILDSVKTNFFFFSAVVSYPIDVTSLQEIRGKKVNITYNMP